MPKPAVEYRRVSRRRRTPLGSAEIWLAEDHLLLVLRHWWTETYQRFRLRDIRSIVIAERPSLRGLQLVGLATTAILLGLAVFVLNSVSRKILLGTPLSIALVWQLTDFLRGPYCRVELATAVSTVRLAPLRRTRAALQFLDVVTPMIEAAQGQWTPEQTADEPQTGWQLSGSAASPPSLPPPRRGAPVVAQWILFGSALVLGSVLLWTHGQVPQQFAGWLWLLAMLAVVLGAIVAISGRGALVRVLAAGAGMAGLVFGIGSFVTFIVAVSDAAREKLDPSETTAYIASQTKYGERPGMALTAFGLGGLGLTLGAGRSRRTKPE